MYKFVIDWESYLMFGIPFQMLVIGLAVILFIREAQQEKKMNYQAQQKIDADKE